MVVGGFPQGAVPFFGTKKTFISTRSGSGSFAFFETPPAYLVRLSLASATRRQTAGFSAGEIDIQPMLGLGEDGRFPPICKIHPDHLFVFFLSLHNQ